MRLLTINDRGREDYAKTLALQESLLAAKASDRSLADTLVFVEHEEIFTVGRSEPPQEPAQVLPKPVRWIEVGRGGKATYHGPGQLVAYPIFDLLEHGKDVHVFLRKVEQSAVRALQRLGYDSHTRSGLTGVWVRDQTGQEKKVVSIGIGVRNWVSYHGLALNVSTDLRYFKAISPCAQSGDVMTSLEEIAAKRGKRPPKMREAKQALVEAFAETFGFKVEGEPGTRPDWLRVRVSSHDPVFNQTRSIVDKLKLVTVCEEARCPNMGECWAHRTATFMIMGEYCTRRCSFCSVKDGTLGNLSPLDPLEPIRVGRAVAELGLRHVVVTSVDRDDVSDMGAQHFHQTVLALQRFVPQCRVELLIPDMGGRRDLVFEILKSGHVEVLNHNVETVPRLYREVRPGANFQRSLNVLRWAREAQTTVKTKSGLMVGLGEERHEVLEVMDRLRECDVNILTIGQYLRPTEKQLPVRRFVTPHEFEEYRLEGLKRGFAYVESGPLVRSSYHAWKHADGADQSAEPAIAAR